MIPLEVRKNNDLLKTYVFDYLSENNGVVLDRDILIALHFLGYSWDWNENLQKLTNVRLGKIKQLKVVKLESTKVETGDLTVPGSNSYVANGLISHNTHNLSPGTSIEEYKDLFMLAWKKGLKGFTSFNPDGNLESILSSKPSKGVSKIERNTAPKRPKELPCDIYEWKVSGESMLVLIGLLENEPYEVFCTHNIDKEIINSGDEKVLIPKIDTEKHKHGIIKKVKKGRYDLLITNGEEKVIAEDIGNTFDENFRTIARLSSGMLRHGADIQFVISQLNKTLGIASFQKAVSRSLKKYIQDGEIKSYGEKPKCTNCGEELVLKDGCNVCPSCGWSKCD